MAYGDANYFSQNTLDAQGRPIYGTAGRQGIYHPRDESGAWWEQDYISRNGVDYTQALAGEMGRHPNNLGYLDQWGGGAIYDPTYGYILPYSTAETSGDWANAQAKPGVMGNLITAMVLGGAGAFGAAAMGAGAGAGALGAAETGAGVGAAEAGAGSVMPDSYWGMLAEGGGTATDAGTGALTGGGGQSASTFNIMDPSTWSNPFSSVPPGASTVAGQAFSGDGAGGLGTDEGAVAGSTGLGADFAGSAGGSTLKNGVDLSTLFGNNWMSLAGSLGGGLLQFLGSKQAAEIQAQYGQQALALIAQQMAQNQANQQPWINAGTAGLNNAGGLLGLPGYEPVDFTKTPGYDFRHQQGLDDLNTRLRAAGQFYSGNAIKAGTEYGQNFASSEWEKALNRDLALAGLGQTSVTNVGNQGTSAANNSANLLTQIGNVEAAGRVSGYNAIGSGISSYMNNQQQLDMMKLLMGGGA